MKCISVWFEVSSDFTLRYTYVQIEITVVFAF